VARLQAERGAMSAEVELLKHKCARSEAVASANAGSLW